MITLIGLQCDLFFGLELLFNELFHLTTKHSLWGCSTVDTGGLDADDKVAPVFEEKGCVVAYNTRLGVGVELGWVGSSGGGVEWGVGNGWREWEGVEWGGGVEVCV